MTETAWLPMSYLCAWLTLPDEEAVAQKQDIVNVDSAMRLWLFLQMITGHDHTAKNVYYIAKYNEESSSDYEFYFAPWDMDLTWGNVSVGEINPVYTEFQPETVKDRVLWDVGDKILDENRNDARKFVADLYEELRKTILTEENLEEMIYALDDQLRDSGAFARDKHRWPQGVHAYNCQELLNYAKERLAFLDNALYDLDYYDT